MIAPGLLRRVRQVGPADLLLLAHTFVLLLTAKIALRTLPSAKILAWKQSQRPRGPHQPAAAARIQWAILIVSRYSPIDFVCFPQCLAASELLRRRGIPTRLHYGATRIDQKLLTHTWLEAEGQILIGAEEATRFSTLAVY